MWLERLDLIGYPKAIKFCAPGSTACSTMFTRASSKAGIPSLGH